VAAIFIALWNFFLQTKENKTVNIKPADKWKSYQLASICWFFMGSQNGVLIAKVCIYYTHPCRSHKVIINFFNNLMLYDPSSYNTVAAGGNEQYVNYHLPNPLTQLRRSWRWTCEVRNTVQRTNLWINSIIWDYCVSSWIAYTFSQQLSLQTKRCTLLRFSSMLSFLKIASFKVAKLELRLALTSFCSCYVHYVPEQRTIHNKH
jgi:hypothetical protein